MSDPNDDVGKVATHPLPSIAPAPLPTETSRYLETIASDAFKRGVDLDEAVWRSLPFFSATLALTAAVIGHASASIPRLSYALFPGIADATLLGAALVLVWSLRWFWQVIRPREYEYPAPPNDIRRYASELVAYHRELGATEDVAGERTVEELRTFLISQYGDAAEINFAHNEARMKARNFALLFMMAALVLAFSCEALIFINSAINPAAPILEKVHDRTVDLAPIDGQAGHGEATGATKSNSRETRSGPLHVPRGSGYPTQAVSDDPQQRKAAPAPSILKRTTRLDPRADPQP